MLGVRVRLKVSVRVDEVLRGRGMVVLSSAALVLFVSSFLSCLTLSCLVLSCLVFAVSSLSSSFFVLFCLVLSCQFLCVVLHYFVLSSHLVLSCLVLPRREEGLLCRT